MNSPDIFQNMVATLFQPFNQQLQRLQPFTSQQFFVKVTTNFSRTSFLTEINLPFKLGTNSTLSRVITIHCLSPFIPKSTQVPHPANRVLVPSDRITSTMTWRPSWILRKIYDHYSCRYCHCSPTMHQHTLILRQIKPPSAWTCFDSLGFSLFFVAKNFGHWRR